MKLVRAKEGYRKVGDKWLIAKKCTKCGEWKVASTVNFTRNKNKKYGLHTECKKCKAIRDKQYCKANKDKKREYDKQHYEANKKKILKRNKQYYETNKEKVAERHKQYYEANRDKILERNKQWYEDNKDKVIEYHKQWYEDNKDKVAKHNKQWREDNKEKILEQHKQYYENNKEKEAERKKRYYEDNKEKVCEQHKRYYEDNKEKISERHKQYYQSPQGQVVHFNKRQRRRAKQEKQGTGITKDQWLEMMKFFDWKCAYSGETLTKDTRSIDHIVPLNSNGDNMIWNVVPMTRSLNSSKQDKDMLEWYKEQDFYDPKRLAKIYEWQEYAYNKWGKDTDYFNTNDIQIKLI